MSNDSAISKFDPAIHRDNVYDAFNEFIDSFRYEYDAIAKEPPAGEAAAQNAWIKQNQRKVFLGRFASRNLQRDYEDVVPLNDRANITFTTMVQRLQERYRPTRNHLLSNYEFHKLHQLNDESFDTFVNRVKHEAQNCQFSCESANISVPNIMIRDQIVIGTINDDIRQNALKNQWDLIALITNGRQLDAAAYSAQRIVADKTNESPINRIKKPGRYSRKNPQKSNIDPKTSRKFQCTNCSSKNCKGHKHCPAYGLECFDCHKKGHFRGSKACKHTKQFARRIESDSESQSDDTDNTKSESSSDNPHEQSVHRLPRKKLTHHISKVYRLRKKRVRRVSRKPNYQVQITIKEQTIPAFADTGADISVMSLKQAKTLNLPLNKCRLKIRP